MGGDNESVQSTEVDDWSPTAARLWYDEQVRVVAGGRRVAHLLDCRLEIGACTSARKAAALVLSDGTRIH